MITVTSYVTTTVFLAAYSAALISFMAVQDVKLPFTTFRGLLQHREYRLGTLQGTAHISYFYVRSDGPRLAQHTSRATSLSDSDAGLFR